MGYIVAENTCYLDTFHAVFVFPVIRFGIYANVWLNVVVNFPSFSYHKILPFSNNPLLLPLYLSNRVEVYDKVHDREYIYFHLQQMKNLNWNWLNFYEGLKITDQRKQYHSTLIRFRQVWRYGMVE